jgi:regulator of cell morphogenesis and NO signaling
MMTITPSTPVSDIARAAPATIRVFQRHQLEFCCTGAAPLADACAERGLDVDAVVAELREAQLEDTSERLDALVEQPVSAIVRHIQARYHEPLRRELPRLEAMLARVVARHGAHLPNVILPLEQIYRQLEQELLEHIGREDTVLFPAIEALESGAASFSGEALMRGPMAVMEDEHADTLSALDAIRTLTNSYAPPEWACPTFRGLYYGLSELERDMIQHVMIEHDVLFPRVAAMSGS